MKRKRIIGIDLGEKNVGVAVSDELGFTAQGLICLRRTDDNALLEHICLLVKQQQAVLIVLGFPKNMNGTIGPKAREASDFAEKIRERSGTQVTLWDERLTSIQAERSMLEGDLSRKKRKKRRDIIAAQIILQSFLDSTSHREMPPEMSDLPGKE
jgi:putative Holliday junction resolvase